jgi:hypothetical protein
LRIERHIPRPSVKQGLFVNADGLWDILMTCSSGAAVREPDANFDSVWYVRKFESLASSGETRIAMVFDSPDRVHLMGQVTFKDRSPTAIDASGKFDPGTRRYVGRGSFGESTGCEFVAVQKDQ